MKEKLIIGLGHRARQGKDYAAEYIKNHIDSDVHIVHWADALYEEVRNKDRKHPLIKYESGIYMLLDRYTKDDSDGHCKPIYKMMPGDKAPKLNAIFLKRDIIKYVGMDEKDSELLQFWGTDFRRASDPDYWVKRTAEKIAMLPEESVVLIPDTRFINELNYIMNQNGYFIEIQRFNEDGSRYYAADRDPNHPSESELDEIDCPHFLITANSGDVNSIEKAITFLYNDIKSKWMEGNNERLQVSALAS